MPASAPAPAATGDAAAVTADEGMDDTNTWNNYNVSRYNDVPPSVTNVETSENVNFQVRTGVDSVSTTYSTYKYPTWLPHVRPQIGINCKS